MITLGSRFLMKTTWRKTLGCALAVSAGFCLAALPILARQQQDAPQQSTGDEVADAARKARQQKKEAPKPKKVYTNEDVTRAAPTGQAAPGATAGQTASNGNEQNPSTTQGANPAAPATPDANDEAAWRKRFKAVRDRIALSEKELSILQRELEQAEVQYYPDPQKTLTEQYTRKNINDKLTKIEAKKLEIAQYKQQLSDLEDDLRKAGGDPGWAR
jgi:chromosome segregation ATPase